MSKDKNADSDKTNNNQATDSDRESGRELDRESDKNLPVQSDAATSEAATSSDKAADKVADKAADKKAEKKADKKAVPKADASKAAESKVTEPKSTESKTTKTPSQKSERRGITGVIITVVLILALAAGGYFGWQYLQTVLQHNSEASIALRDQLDAQNRTIAELRNALAADTQNQRTQLAQQEQQLNQLQLRISSQGRRLRDLSTATRDDWLLAEAEYLLRLANQRLLTERTTKNPVSLLISADEILREFDDPDLFAVRKQIARDITTLRVAGTVDREGIYLQLVSLADLIPQLRLLVKPWEQGTTEPVTEPAAEEPNWGERLWANTKSFFGSLDDYIRINDRSAPVEPLLSPSEESYLRHNLQLMLEQAQLAVLREEPAVYRTSLQKSWEWLDMYFELNPQAEVFQQQLEALMDQPIDQRLPDISGSLEGLRNYINLWHLRHEGAKPKQPSQQSQILEENAE